MNTRYTYLTDQRNDVEKAKGELERIIGDITGEMTKIFAEQFKLLSESFQTTFRELFGGGDARLELEDEEDILGCGIEIKAQPPGKTLKTISLLSGGEKAFVAIALYFAILKVHPTPFCVMDEIEAALDDANVTRYARYMRQPDGKDAVHRHHPPPGHHGGGRRPLRRHHAGAGCEQDPDHQPERHGEGTEDQVSMVTPPQGSRRNPAKRFRWEKEEQGSGCSFRRRRKRSTADFATTPAMQEQGVSKILTIKPERHGEGTEDRVTKTGVNG